jgi:hypothetical protein
VSHALFCSLILLAAPPAQEKSETARYLRVTPKGIETECTFRTERDERGSTLESVTERGGSAMTVTARYDAADRLLSAEATVRTGERRRTVKVSVAEGKARVERSGADAQVFDAPRGVIVTSAPDWTDTLILSRRHDRKAPGRQEFPGLWIHPAQPAQRLTFSVEKTGAAGIEHGGEKIELDRLEIRLRGDSRYAAWVDAAGRMIKLVSLPFKEGGTHLVLEGFEKAAATLAP